MKRAIIMVLDSLGVGELPDAAKYTDAGCDTLGHIAENAKDFNPVNLINLGMGNIDGVNPRMPRTESPAGCFARCAEMSLGKDTTTGHWEIAGLYTDVPFKTYPDGFPKEFIEAYQERIGREVIGNYPASGTEIIEVLGDEHEKTGKPIVYTSADSVFQIACNVGVVPLDELYKYCEIAREMLQGEWACGRVIARPYIKNAEGKRERTSDRKDYSVKPPKRTILNMVQDAGMVSASVGKISDIFDRYGVDLGIHLKNNMDGVDRTIQALATDFEGLLFVNLVDFDAKYGHRRDVQGYGDCIMEFDARVPEILAALKDEDIIIFTADHGNDPTAHGTDHTREYTPMIAFGKPLKNGVNLGTLKSFADIGCTCLEYLGIEERPEIGQSFLKEILK
ncbi:MAG: phosphopentomutase [Clostridia bacterium]|nr:phosphopentomutase [Clostridia bacterium]